MKAIGLTRYLPITDPASLQDFELDTPVPSGRDLLIKIEAIAVNPVDTKIRAPKATIEPQPRVLGWDAAGAVIAMGPDASLFQTGDLVYYAGSLTRPGANSEYHLVDERLVGLKPTTLDFAQAAALPLTTLTAWEALFDRLGIAADGQHAGKSLLLIGGAGGVGSMAIQLARQLAGLTVIATASRERSAQWCRELGAHHVVNHQDDLTTQLLALGQPMVDFILCANDTDRYFADMASLIAPQGKICALVDNRAPLPMALLKSKSATFAWEFMFTRAMFATPDMIQQHRVLMEVARLIDAGILRTTIGQVLSPINAANLRIAHAQMEAGTSIGKLVLQGF